MMLRSIFFFPLLFVCATNVLALSSLSHHRGSLTVAQDQQQDKFIIPTGVMYFMTMKGQTQGDIKGSCTTRGREQQIQLISMQHEVISPRDPASGLPTGRRMHKPFVFTKELDKSTPIMYRAFFANENLPVVNVHAWRPAVGVRGLETQIYTIQLINANIASLQINEDGKLVFTLTYQKMELTWRDGGIMASDDWVERT